jgi:hypothetical protein
MSTQIKKTAPQGHVIKRPLNVPHWHGASKDQMFIQTTITSSQPGPTVCLQPVSDEEYNR